MKKPVTKWYKMNAKTGKFEYNHYEDGHSKSNKPKPSGEQQQIWLIEIWRKEHAYMEFNRIIEL